MKIASIASAIALAATGAMVAGQAEARDQIRIVGSSTVYPFTTSVAEQFGRTTKMKTPVVESTGTGGGFKLFCSGVGANHPDASNASRAMRKSEFSDCQKNGVKEVVELKIGFDGLSLAQSKSGNPLNLSMAQVFLALAKEVPGKDGKLVPNPNRMWSDIHPSLPNIKIEVLGPPPTSGTRDAFHELFMEVGALSIPAMAAIRKSDGKAFERAWKTLRDDGLYIEAGENDNVIVQKLEANRNAVGIFGFSFLDENTAKLRGVAIDGTVPTYEAIADGKYKGSRPLFVYIKKQHIGVVPGLDKFAAEYVSARALGADGYLARKGLVTLPKAELQKVRDIVNNMVPMQAPSI